MCGIVGALNLKQADAVDGDMIASMLGAIRHRGPDQFGVYTQNNGRYQVGLGSARLSIIDLGGGQQPIGNEDNSRWIVFNGEIFNYVELRPQLEALGHTFRTDSDTEVILHLYETYGADCLHHLNGQFAFAIWDEHSGELFLARDRVGIRPLYYATHQNTFYFTSEMKALFAAGCVPARLDPVALDQIFTYWSPLSPRTIFQEICTLPPGHWLRVTGNGRIHTHRYWQPTFPTNESEHIDLTLDEAAAHLRQLLIDATRIRLRADVPVGAYLSGGLDSSTITALIHHYTNRRLETFSIAFSDEEYDESQFQQQMANHLGTRHNLITCTPQDIGEAFPEVIRHTETPILRTSPAPLFLLSKLVHDHQFKVVLTGEGADEFLGGYNIFKEAAIRRFWARQPDSALRPTLLHKLYPYIATLSQGSDAYLQRFFGQNLTATADPYYSHFIRWRNTARSRRFFSAELTAVLPETAVPHLPPDFARWTPLAQAQFLEIDLFLAEYLLSSQGDRVAMAHSVEGRFPFLDHRVIAFCNRLPPAFKLRGLNEKMVLKHAMRDLLPPAIWQRPKRPYRAPIHRSFFPNGQPLPWVADILSPTQINSAGLFNSGAVSALSQKITRLGKLGETDEMALTGILSTQLIYHHFIKQPLQPTPLQPADDVKVVSRP